MGRNRGVRVRAWGLRVLSDVSAMVNGPSQVSEIGVGPLNFPS